MTVSQFECSAEASSGPLCDQRLPLGRRIYEAARRTWEVSGCNTNLGILLLAAPLLYAVQNMPKKSDLRRALAGVIEQTSVDDAIWTFEAIKLMSPAGLGEAPEQDVRDKPAVTLRDAMFLAKERDRVAYQFSSNYEDIFCKGVPALQSAMYKWQQQSWGTVMVFMTFLSEIPDSHIARKFGIKTAFDVSEKAARVKSVLTQAEKPDEIFDDLLSLDRQLKGAGLNPGTSADMTVTTLLAADLIELIKT